MLKYSALLALCLVASVVASNYRVDTNTKFFTDEFGRAVLFHGVNAVYKLPPFYPPVLDSFDPTLSLSDQDFLNLRKWGLNTVRLYVAWEGVEPVRGEYNYTYLDTLKRIVQTAARYDVNIILDAHQDVGLRKFCGEGLPSWTANRTNFPAPLTVKIGYDADGNAIIEDCLKDAFFKYTLTDDVKKVFQALYENENGLGDSFADFWGVVADHFKDEPNVIGYELINEPVPDSWTSLLNLHNEDLKELEPLYTRAHVKIREVDDETIILFEPTVTDGLSIGFDKGPGGSSYNDRQAFAYHIYCPLVKNTDPINDYVCKVFDSKAMEMKVSAAQNLGVASFLTEFGATSNIENGNTELKNMADLADNHLQSWTYWQYKYYNDFTTAASPGSLESFFNEDGTIQTNKVKELARSYAYATCGVPLSQEFDSTKGTFTYKYQAKQNCGGQGTEVFLSKEFYYPNGVSVSFEGCGQCSLEQISGEDSYYVVNVPAGLADNTEITLKVVPV